MIHRIVDNCIITDGPAVIKVPFIDSMNSDLYRRYKQLCSGCEITCTDIHSLCRGVVIFIGTATEPSVTVQYNASVSITYAHLATTLVHLGSVVNTGDVIGTADAFVRVEALVDGPSRTWPVRIGAMQYYKQDPENYIDGSMALPDSAADAYSSTVYPETYDYTLLKPYVATLTRTSPTPDWSALKANRVSGVVAEAGYLFDINHIRQSKYMNPKLPAWIESIKQAGLVLGYLFYARAATAAEASEELYEFSYVIRQWPSTLGVWVVPTFTASTVNNDAMLDRYRSGFDNLGLTGAIGLYVTRAQLAKCTWSTQQQYWQLWLIDHTATVSEFDKLLTPDFFRLDS